jgi:AcrR family transcriptional regulator
MSIPRSNAGDPERTLALLWRDPSVIPRRGPQRGLDLDAVVNKAIDIADREGLAAVTMRRVAQALRVAPMTLYTYVPGKAEMVDLMLDVAYLHMARAATEGRPWRQRLTVVAEENRQLLTTHPWVAGVCTLRPPLGPGAIAKYGHELAALDGLGLTDVEMDDCLTYLLMFVQANARAASDTLAIRHETAMNDEQWWTCAGPVLARYVDSGSHPLATRVGTAAGAEHGSAHDPEHAYRFGLQRVLDGLAVLIDHRQ